MVEYGVASLEWEAALLLYRGRRSEMGEKFFGASARAVYFLNTLEGRALCAGGEGS